MRSNCAILCLLSLSWRLENIAFCEFLEGFLSAAREAEAAGASLDDVVELAALPHLHTRTYTQTLTVMNHGYSKKTISMVRLIPFLALMKA